MAGRYEKAISSHKPAQELAAYLRDLRVRAGKPSYRQLGALVYVTHHALSQTVDGRYVRWDRVELFLRALELFCPGLVAPEDRMQLQHLHALATERWKLSNRPLKDPRRPAATRARGAWNTRYGWIIGRLNAATSRSEVHAILRDLLDVLNKADPDGPRHAPNPIRLEDITLEQIRLIVTAAGGSDGDFLAWSAAWDRTEAPPATPPRQRQPDPGEATVLDLYGSGTGWGPPSQELAYHQGSRIRRFTNRRIRRDRG